MKMSESITEIAKAIAAVQSSLPVISKDKDNPITKSKYATLDAINKALLPLTSKQGIAVTQYPVSDNGQIGCGTLLMHSSGEFIQYDPYLITVGSNKRMSAAQEGGSTITYAKRYQLSAIFGIVTDDDSDGNSQQSQGGPQNGYPNQNYQRGNVQQNGDPRQGRQTRSNNQRPTRKGPKLATQKKRQLIVFYAGEIAFKAGTNAEQVSNEVLAKIVKGWVGSNTDWQNLTDKDATTACNNLQSLKEGLVDPTA